MHIQADYYNSNFFIILGNCVKCLKYNFWTRKVAQFKSWLLTLIMSGAARLLSSFVCYDKHLYQFKMNLLGKCSISGVVRIFS